MQFPHLILPKRPRRNRYNFHTVILIIYANTYNNKNNPDLFKTYYVLGTLISALHSVCHWCSQQFCKVFTIDIYIITDEKIDKMKLEITFF